MQECSLIPQPYSLFPYIRSTIKFNPYLLLKFLIFILIRSTNSQNVGDCLLVKGLLIGVNDDLSFLLYILFNLPYSLKILRTKIFMVYQISLEIVIFMVKKSWIGCPPSGLNFIQPQVLH